MSRDTIVDEVRKVRQETEAACSHDWTRLMEHYLQVQKRSQQRVVSGSPRRMDRVIHRRKSPES